MHTGASPGGIICTTASNSFRLPERTDAGQIFPARPPARPSVRATAEAQGLLYHAARPTAYTYKCTGQVQDPEDPCDSGPATKPRIT